MDDSIIISFCNFQYKKLAEIWVNELKKLDINNYIIISTGKKHTHILNLKI